MTMSEPASTGGEPNPGHRSSSWPEASRASPPRRQVTGSGSPTSGGSGPTWRTSFAYFDRASSSWRTCQGSLFEDSMPSSVTWPRSGMTRRGTAYLLPPSVPLISETESGSWPTPTASVWKGPQPLERQRGDRLRPVSDDTLATRVERAERGLWPTPTARLGVLRGMPKPNVARRRWFAQGRRNLDDAVSMWPGGDLPSGTTGPLNPRWVEWLMGLPTDWTASRD